LSSREFDEGLAALRRYAERDAQGSVAEPIDFFVLSVRNASAAAE
jgi:hypothetical protein